MKIRNSAELCLPAVPVLCSAPPPAELVKVDAEPVVMATYFAVQLLRCEHVKDVAFAVMVAAEARGLLFRKLQMMDVVPVGTSLFVRFRSDLGDVSAALGGLNRGYIAFSGGNYRVTFPNSRPGGKLPTSIMCSVQKAGFGGIFAGPKIQRWRAQFQPNA